MNIAFIGAGSVGRTLGTRLRDIGHTVCWGVPHVGDTKYKDLAAVGSVAQVVQNAEVVFLTVPWSAVQSAIQSAGPGLDGKILVDVTNPVASDFSGLADLNGLSAAEHIALWSPGANVVKAFNTIGHDVMANPKFGDKNASLLVAANEADAKQIVMDLAQVLGFEPVDAGPLAMARHLESLAWLWITLAMKQGHGRDIVFQLLRR